ncbi:MAG: hypothetical protein AAGB32_06135 [Pseudomonadota bacterium]
MTSVSLPTVNPSSFHTAAIQVKGLSAAATIESANKVALTPA